MSRKSRDSGSWAAHSTSSGGTLTEALAISWKLASVPSTTRPERPGDPGGAGGAGRTGAAGGAPGGAGSRRRAGVDRPAVAWPEAGEVDGSPQSDRGERLFSHGVILPTSVGRSGALGREQHLVGADDAALPEAGTVKTTVS